MTKSVDGGILITGSFQDYNLSASPCLLLKTDINGNEIWRQKINKSSPNVMIGSSILQDSATKRILIVGYQYIGSSTSSGNYSNILILDSLGNKLIQTTYNNSGGAGFGNVIQLKDKNFLSCGNWNSYNSGSSSYYEALIVKFDIYGNLLWSKKYNTANLYNYFGVLCSLSNGDIVLAGSLQLSDLSNIIKFQVLKMDLNGNTKWHRVFSNATNDNNSDGPISINPMQDGGFLLATGFYSMPSPKPYSFMKIDSTGCDTTEVWCTSVILGVDKFNEISSFNFELFPNPANDVVNLKIGLPIDKPLQLKITDVSAREIESIELRSQQDQQINTSTYKEGLYFVNLCYEGKMVEVKKLIIVR